MVFDLQFLGPLERRNPDSIPSVRRSAVKMMQEKEKPLYLAVKALNDAAEKKGRKTCFGKKKEREKNASGETNGQFYGFRHSCSEFTSTR